MSFNIRIKNKLNNYFTLGGQNQGKATFPNLFRFLWPPSILKLVAQPWLHLHQWPHLIYHRVSSQTLPMTSLILGSPLKLRLLLQWPLMASHCATSADFHDHFITSKPLWYGRCVNINKLSCLNETLLWCSWTTVSGWWRGGHIPRRLDVDDASPFHHCQFISSTYQHWPSQGSKGFTSVVQVSC